MNNVLLYLTKLSLRFEFKNYPKSLNYQLLCPRKIKKENKRKYIKFYMIQLKTILLLPLEREILFHFFEKINTMLNQ